MLYPFLPYDREAGASDGYFVIVNQSHRPRRSSPRATGRTSAWWIPNLDLPKIVAATFVGLIACSLIAAGVGPAIFDGLANRNNDVNVDEINGQAESSLRREIENNPNDYASMAALANLLANTDRLAEAIPWYERAIGAQPENAELRLDFAQALAGGGKQQDAELQFAKILEQQPDNERAHYYLGELYRTWAPPRTADASREYRTVVDLAPDSVVADRAREQLQVIGAPIGMVEGSPAASPAIEGGS